MAVPKEYSLNRHCLECGIHEEESGGTPVDDDGLCSDCWRINGCDGWCRGYDEAYEANHKERCGCKDSGRTIRNSEVFHFWGRL